MSCWVDCWYLGPASRMTDLEEAEGICISSGKDESYFYSDECNVIGVFVLAVRSCRVDFKSSLYFLSINMCKVFFLLYWRQKEIQVHSTPFTFKNV